MADRLLLRAALLGVARRALARGHDREGGERDRLSARRRSLGRQGAAPPRSRWPTAPARSTWCRISARSRAVASALVAADIEAVVRAVPGIPVKVILETAALTDEEKKRGVPAGARGGRRFRQDVDRLSSGGRGHGRRRAPDARRSRARASASRRRAEFAASTMRARCSRQGQTASARPRARRSSRRSLP